MNFGTEILQDRQEPGWGGDEIIRLFTEQYKALTDQLDRTFELKNRLCTTVYEQFMEIERLRGRIRELESNVMESGGDSV